MYHIVLYIKIATKYQEFALGGGCFGAWKHHQTILTQILIDLRSDWVDFFVQIKVISKKKKKVKASFGLFSFLLQNSASNVLKTGYFAYSSGRWEGARAPRPGCATGLDCFVFEAVSMEKIFIQHYFVSNKNEFVSFSNKI